MELRQKDENAVMGAFKTLKVSLIWKAGVDLDLMAFYKTKDGKVGGVYSENYTGGTLGDLNQFPFIRLSGDAGLGAASGDNREELHIAKLDDFEALYIVALNFTDAASGSNKVFADYDASVEVVTDKGEAHQVTLDSDQTGSVAILCKFTSGFMGTSLVNNSEVMPFEAFQAAIPGASAIRLSSKIILKQKGEKANLTGNNFHARLTWKAGVDLDLHCFYRLRGEAPEPPKKGLLSRLLSGREVKKNHVFFAQRGARSGAPWIYLDQDAGIGDEAGNNEENIYFTNIEKIEHAIIAANIFNKPDANFASYDGKVVITGGGNEIEVPLIESKPGSWCLICRIDNSGKSAQLINLNKTQVDEPDISQFR